MIKIKHPEWLHVVKQYKTFYGFDQKWYRRVWRRTAGCGPTCATMTLIYLNKRNNLKLPYKNQGYNSIVDSMNKIWEYVTPGLRGLNTLELYQNGIARIATENKIELNFQKRKIDAENKPPLEEVVDFVTQGLKQDVPVGFLNWHNGNVTGLDDWHWVLIVAIEGNKIFCYDQGKKLSCDLKEWLEHTKKGGGFVYYTAKI
ncbi:MAG: hypothetical protein FWE25_02350 [Lachnospiraceae bacterium]|nr:hypothetical protein [Lachnospiraceae bacterium]